MSAYNDFMEKLLARTPNEPEFHSAVSEVMADIFPIIMHNDDYKNIALADRLTEPERTIMFRVVWQDDKGEVQVNRGYRVQFNGAIGPYKGGLRFHPSVNLSILKFLGFEQTFKNALTGLPLGGGKGGSDFDPSGRSPNEIRRFCTAFMGELYRHIGEKTDIPAGDINVGSQEIGWMIGEYRRLTNRYDGTLTGKGLTYGGSQLRTEATGYGLGHFMCRMLGEHDMHTENQTVVISGAGNVALHAAEKCLQLGSKVVSLSDSDGTIYDQDGLDSEKLDWVKTHKSKSGASLEAYQKKFGGKWMAGATPWGLSCDVALPCATQNELEKEDAKKLVQNGVKLVAEGANMPCTGGAKEIFADADVIFAPGKAANAGGVAVSGLEISQNRLGRSRSWEELDTDLKDIMNDIHDKCVEESRAGEGPVNYVRGANVAGFRKVADAMVAQGY